MRTAISFCLLFLGQNAPFSPRFLFVRARPLALQAPMPSAFSWLVAGPFRALAPPSVGKMPA